MITYTIWNKKDSIGKGSADYIIKTHNIQGSDDVILIFNCGKVTEIQIVNTLKINYNMDKNLTTEEVAQEYIRIKEEEKLQAEKEQVTIEEMGNKISILTQENEVLKLELSVTQDAVNELLFNAMSSNI